MRQAFCHIVFSLMLLSIFSCTKEHAVPISASFDIQVVDNDYSVPVKIKIKNTTQGADTYSWTFEGGSPPNSKERNPSTIIYDQAGKYTIKLVARNRDSIVETIEKTIPIDDEIVVAFEAKIVTNNFSPMEVALTNTTVGAKTYQWTFEGGTPASTTLQHPENVVFNDAGNHNITLEVSNGLETYRKLRTVTVVPHLAAAFDYQVAFQDDDLQAPVTLTMNNNSVSATSYIWTFANANPDSSTDKNPTITLATPATYTLALSATNGKKTNTNSRTITVLPNTNLTSFEDLKLGINTAHYNNTHGAFFSTTTRKIYSRNDDITTDGALIDIVFFGLNQNFISNRFVSPTELQTTSFDPIPNATSTKIINRQEASDSSASMTIAAFDAMTDDTPLRGLTITEATRSSQDFDQTTMPRVILFQNHEGRKGAIKIKEFVVDGENSYVVVDIKVQKENVP